jgi:hypothetical protein
VGPADLGVCGEGRLGFLRLAHPDLIQQIISGLRQKPPRLAMPNPRPLLDEAEVSERKLDLRWAAARIPFPAW